MMSEIVYYVREDDTNLGRPHLDGAQPTNQMAVPMMILCLILELTKMDVSMATEYEELTVWAIEQTRAHIQVSVWEGGGV